MGRFVWKAGAAFFLCVLLSVGGAEVQAQLLDGEWFEVTVKAKGYEVKASNLNWEKASFEGRGFIRFHWIGDSYIYEIWNKVGPGQWEPTYFSDEIVPDGKKERFWPDMNMTFRKPDGVFVSLYATCLFTIETNASDKVVQASIKSLGAEVYSGSLDGKNRFYGGAKLSGSRVRERDLPFDPGLGSH
jgi:hypothetical protein